MQGGKLKNEYGKLEFGRLNTTFLLFKRSNDKHKFNMDISHNQAKRFYKFGCLQSLCYIRQPSFENHMLACFSHIMACLSRFSSRILGCKKSRMNLFTPPNCRTTYLALFHAAFSFPHSLFLHSLQFLLLAFLHHVNFSTTSTNGRHD